MDIRNVIQIISGDSYTLECVFEGYSETDYTITATILNDITQSFTVTGGVLTITSAQSSEFLSGDARLFVYAVKDAQRTILYESIIKISPDPLTSTVSDFTTHNQKMLAAIEAFIEKRATNQQIDILESEIDGKRLQRMPFTELLQLRDIYKNKVMTENGTKVKKIVYTFTR